jgi:hypothetical protein
MAPIWGGTEMKDFITYLAEQSRNETVSVGRNLDDALARLDHALAGLSAELQVEYYGPHIGVETPDAHQMVVRLHEWKMNEPTWSLKVCSTAPQANYRAEWPVQGTGRLRKQLIVKALPAFFRGYALAVAAAGKSDTAAGQRVEALAKQFNP